MKSLSRVPLLVTPWAAAYQARPSMGFSRQEYWSGLALPSPKKRLWLGKKVMTKLDSMLKSRDVTLPTKICLAKAMVYPYVMYGWESWTIKKVGHQRFGAFELWRPNHSILKEIRPEYTLEGQIWTWNSNTLATWCKELTHLEVTLICLWVWEPNLGAGPQGQLLLNNNIKASAFQPCVTLSTQETGKAIYLGGRKGRWENVFSGLSSQLGFGSSEVRPPSLLQEPQFPSQGRVSPYTFRALQTHF